ncbi:glutathione S-transferase family protein [Alterisphingorhabdus coralli]|uniref:Glutathione S-transferase family protein n=1 Tax=Alterisphingorhabdus coralli TaxID=3071408 RepID=A0AA97I1Y9_9SPHN|nr:glutathione S-transferase family protein [Parasphingorhabdus sp. SCSIO 66989]WOE75230.1 glutathione S-transferase family protein [Parasphingorhabdus sp. SCSIO 66989]
MLDFYTNPMSRGQIARWALHEAGAEYQQHLMSYDPSDENSIKSEAYLAINPMGKLPAIADDGKVITECAAICAYLAERFPDSGLAPQDDSERADYYRWLFYASGPLETAITNKSMGFAPSDEQTRMAGYGNFEMVMDVLDGFLSSRDYVCGARFTMADVYLGSQVDWGMSFGTMEKRDSFIAYAERMRPREAYKAAKAIDGELIAKAQAAQS